MKKKKLKEWRNCLIDALLIQFTALNEKNNKRLRKSMEKSMDNTIGYYISLLTESRETKRSCRYLSTSHNGMLQTTWVARNINSAVQH